SRSVEKYSRRLKPYQRGFFVGAVEVEASTFGADSLCPENARSANPKGRMAAEARVAAVFSRSRRVQRVETDADVCVAALSLLTLSIVPPIPPRPIFLPS